MNTPDKMLAEKLLHISAIKLQPSSPFVWSSGWNSPIYNDNRKALSYPDVRNFIKIEMARLIMEKFPEAQAVASVANGAIAFGLLAADAIGIPFAYVRDTPKDHGLENTIEGNLKPGWKVVVIEDLVSTGGTSLRAVETVSNAGCEVIGMAALFNYEFPVALKRFREANLTVVSLCNYTSMLEVAEKIHFISNSEARTLREWRENPGDWMPEPTTNLL
ncbi:MAG: orotate phosphoribosyltransferase [Muribaculaceae bacterium]|nr:orotate phosphoribosyltransferase [Muribaculaceae bacterium]